MDWVALQSLGAAIESDQGAKFSPGPVRGYFGRTNDGTGT